jgi:iron complex outermembrane recepter protein
MQVTRMCGLLAGLMLALCGAATAAEPPASTPEEPRDSRDTAAKLVDEHLEELAEVIVYGTSGELIVGLHAESELDAEGIAAYGANTVGELLNQVAPDVDNSEQGPLILVNGKPRNGIRSVNDLPPESIARVQVLPPGAAAALGESPTRRVINVVLKTQFRQGTGSVTAKAATAGRGTSTEGNLSTLRLVGNNIRNFSIYGRKVDPLLEAHRDIRTQGTVVPYDRTGNLVAWPLSGGEIDADLSAAAGFPVTVAGVPAGNAAPLLDDFVPFANNANTSDMGRYRTLVADQYSYGLNGNTGRQLPHNISLNINANLDRNESRSRTGATSTTLHVPGSSPFSPFDNDVGIARYLGRPLRQEREATNANISVNLSTQLGKWRLMSDTNAGWNRSVTDSERRVDTAQLQAAIDAGEVNPFDELPDDMLDAYLSDRARARGYNISTRLGLAGALFTLPAGKANANLSAQWLQNGQRSRTVGTNNVRSSRTREDLVVNMNLQLPLLGTPQSQGFGMGGELGGAARNVTATGTLFTYGLGLNVRNGNRVTMRIGYNREKQAPQPGALNDPIVTIDDYRAYDFLRDETVLVRYITGGNPDLRVENRDIITLSGQVRPLKTVDFTLNGQYTRTIYHDPMAALPPPSAEVQAAFPDRFRRDADGRLFEIDARQVNFVSTKNEQVRWGGNFRRSFGVPAGAAPGAAAMSTGTMVINGVTQVVNFSDGSESLAGAGWRLNANFTHQWQVAYKRLMRPDLPRVDLLSGGAGFGTPQSRHRVQSTLGLAYNGTGAQLNSNWTSASHLDTGTATAPSRLDFGSTLRFDLQAFTNVGTLFPATKSLQGVRISLAVENVLDSKQRVKDQDGVTPLRYQPYLMNPLGRVLSLSFRKAFS